MVTAMLPLKRKGGWAVLALPLILFALAPRALAQDDDKEKDARNGEEVGKERPRRGPGRGFGKPGGGNGEHRRPKPGDRRRKHERGRHFLDSMSKDQRRKFHENLELWKSMSPEQKQSMHERHKRLMGRLKREFETQLEEKGITLDSEERRRTFIAYLLLRRQFENRLREDADAKRKEALPGIFDAAIEKARGEGAPEAAFPGPTGDGGDKET